MWALIIVHCGQNWGFWTLMTEMPSYMNAVLKFDMAKVIKYLLCISLNNILEFSTRDTNTDYQKGLQNIIIYVLYY